MGLVGYSDSEGSDAESAPPAPKPTLAKPAFPKVIDRSEPKKIKVDLPAIRPEPAQQDDEQRPAKRAKTGGAFSGFNEMLPAPKGRVQSGPKPGVSLKTSSEAAFSRAPVDDGAGTGLPAGAGVGERAGVTLPEQKDVESKMVGKATKFKPLSVANQKKKPVKKPKPPTNAGTHGATAVQTNAKSTSTANGIETDTKSAAAAEVAAPKPRRSLFSVQTEDAAPSEPANADTYEAIVPTEGVRAGSDLPSSTQPPPSPAASDPNSLQSIASDLNLTAAQRRQLFGRHAKGADVNIAHFNMDSEYAANEQARQAGDIVEHRAVKAIAPGKHSLQQLVNNARTQQGAMEDKWAEGRRERGEAGGKYGWGK